MALRVLLADESATIKKVIQLALQDFGVEVKSVPVGTDVLAVAKSFMPDIVFADVLLTKRNGYEVCADLKNDAELEVVPVVLMWSGFMELDQGKVLSSRVDRSLEKPFDADHLRNLVKELVPRLQANMISNYLQFPERPEFMDDQAGAYAEADQAAVEEAVAQDPFAHPDDGEEHEAEEFKHVPLPRRREPGTAAREFQSPREAGDEWSQADLAKFRVGTNGASDEIPLPEIDEDVNDSAVVWSSTGEEVSIHNFDRAGVADAKSGLTRTGKRQAPAVNEGSRSRISLGTSAGIPNLPESSSHDAHLNVPNLDYERAEQILREQSRDVLETIAWRILPDVVERVVREELQKLLKDSERLDEI
ncbi:MAG: response regulator [Bdellovibrionaceae bacterium]|nr:response regulator [Pseudobdellovibrionaceae bacterium]